ncbi:hypothetical protein Ddc_08359 [Ditylenchus destructor]|nr:hypothetical protein Ddc_08359 [Ditylenchus destructor]
MQANFLTDDEDEIDALNNYSAYSSDNEVKKSSQAQQLSRYKNEFLSSDSCEDKSPVKNVRKRFKKLQLENCEYSSSNIVKKNQYGLNESFHQNQSNSPRTDLNMRKPIDVSVEELDKKLMFSAKFPQENAVVLNNLEYRFPKAQKEMLYARRESENDSEEDDDLRACAKINGIVFVNRIQKDSFHADEDEGFLGCKRPSRKEDVEYIQRRKPVSKIANTKERLVAFGSN